MFTELGRFDVPAELRAAAEQIKHQNYKTNTPKQFRVLPLHEQGCELLKAQIAAALSKPIDRIDFVYFSACKGAEPHTDLLDPAKYEPLTVTIPIILPKGLSLLVLHDMGLEVELELDHGIAFNHEQTHELVLEDLESGCVVVMASVLR